MAVYIPSNRASPPLSARFCHLPSFPFSCHNLSLFIHLFFLPPLSSSSFDFFLYLSFCLLTCLLACLLPPPPV
ncbi:hypothetical protein M441DRAFT_300649 [Trichoderma asperellum CBS 433.97]|uniref:Uncharacterized protein n=1 Tax=Trichoderma asperellum (strain ATCC 204424 / CBS 433.97 / NBRC 101777) TaxID=1042311 RepID=A0A2T3ZJE8_TRIA4|nr:hypothetical protein M441DRAFT_300649 [Trichoderma asperellum CBS 433.97]PTB44893.1 hypothetical protein M441DRAFT_300649 [Trichoderma asperellum CBS 433.97]